MKADDCDRESVSPLEVFHLDRDSDGDDEREIVGETCERLSLETEGGDVRKLIDPSLPSQKEIEEHNIRAHIPYRNWCPVCIKARGKEMDHTGDKGKQRLLPEYQFDYCFPGDEFGFKWTVLVGKERMSKSWFATAVPQKGASGKFASDKCIEYFEENGDGEGKIIIKTDQEPSIEFLIKDIVDDRKEGRTIVEESPVKSSGSNGVAESGVQEIEGGIRAVLLGLQERIGRKIDRRERIIGFIPEYAAYMTNRLSQGKDGQVHMKG